MKFIKTEISDVYIIEPSVFGDNRGYFLESFNLEKFEDQLDDLARNLAEQQDADVEITNFYPKFLFKTLKGGQK